MPPSPSITLDNVTLSHERHPAVHHLSGVFEPGSLTAVTGPNGAGKSTLMKAIAGIHAPDGGHIRISGSGNNVAYLPQVAEIQRDFPMSLLHMVSAGFWARTGGLRAITPAMRGEALEALYSVGLRGFEHHSLSSLSAGQFQRALFARLLVQDASLILLDEPFSAIDASTIDHLMEIVHRWHREGRTVLCVLHDFEQIRQHFPHCLLLARECIAWDQSARALHPENLLKARFFRQEWVTQPEICERAL